MTAVVLSGPMTLYKAPGVRKTWLAVCGSLDAQSLCLRKSKVKKGAAEGELLCDIRLADVNEILKVSKKKRKHCLQLNTVTHEYVVAFASADDMSPWTSAIAQLLSAEDGGHGKADGNARSSSSGGDSGSGSGSGSSSSASSDRVSSSSSSPPLRQHTGRRPRTETVDNAGVSSWSDGPPVPTLSASASTSALPSAGASFAEPGSASASVSEDLDLASGEDGGGGGGGEGGGEQGGEGGDGRDGGDGDEEGLALDMSRVDTSRKGIFEATIEQGLWRECLGANDVHPMVRQCVAFVEKWGLDTEGIYRVPGGQKTIGEFRTLIDAGASFDFPDHTDPNVAGGLLKLYLRTLAEPIIPFDLHHAFTSVASFSDSSYRPLFMKLLVEHLPAPNRALLSCIVEHLTKVVAHAKQNKMKLHNIALLFGGIFLRAKDESAMEMMRNTPLVSQCANVLVGDYDRIFNPRGSAFSMHSCVVALFPFAAADESEINLEPGDIIFVEQESNDEWLTGWKDTQSGLFPANYVQTLVVFTPPAPFESPEEVTTTVGATPVGGGDGGGTEAEAEAGAEAEAEAEVDDRDAAGPDGMLLPRAVEDMHDDSSSIASGPIDGPGDEPLPEGDGSEEEGCGEGGEGGGEEEGGGGGAVVVAAAAAGAVASASAHTQAPATTTQASATTTQASAATTQSAGGDAVAVLEARVAQVEAQLEEERAARQALELAVEMLMAQCGELAERVNTLSV